MFRSLRPSATAAAILVATSPWRPLANAHVAPPSATSNHLLLTGQASIASLSSVALLASRRGLHLTASPLLASGKKSGATRRKVRGMPGSARRASATSASIRAAAAVAGTAASANAARAPGRAPTTKSAPEHTTKDESLEDEVASADALADREHGARHAHLGAPEEEEGALPYSASPAHSHLGEAEEVELAAQITDVRADVGEGEANVAEVEDDMSERMDPTASSSPVSPAMAGDGSTAHTAPTVAVGSLLDFESPLNLRLSTLTRQDGKAFRAMTVVFPLERASMNFEMTFEDIASGARLTCKVDDLVSEYYPWVAQFRASFIVIFLPTMQHPNATLLQNAILHRHPARPPVPADVAIAPRFQEDPDHLFFSYTKLREIISHKKNDVTVNSQLLTVAVLNAYPDEWKAYITTPGACAPQPFLLATFNFKNKDGSILNKELLHAQLSLTAEAKHATAVAAVASQKSSSGGGRKHGAHNPATVLVKSSDPWTLVFVSAPVKSSSGIPNAMPPMQDLLTGQFIEPLSLSEKKVVYIVGSGSAAAAFSIFPPMRKGKLAYSILLQDVELQLGMSRHQRSTLTLTLARALDTFSRFTWLNLMEDELQRRPGQKREPGSQNSFYRLQRRTVQREILPSFLESVFAPAQRLAGGGEASGVAAGGGHGVNQNGAAPFLAARSPRQLEAHMNVIFNNEDRLQRERQLKDTLCGCKVLMVHLNTAGVTAARRADNPFSTKNGIVEASTQMWTSITVPNPPNTLVHTSKASASGARTFISPDAILPKDFPIGPRDAPNPADRAENAVLVAWDVKRVLLFLRESRRLREFLANGGRVWCAQYAQYMLKGFNQHNLATMERTLVQFHNGPLKSQMRPLAKLKLVYETQLDLAVNSRQLTSIVHRMDGLLASAEMEANGLQLVPQSRVTQFADNLRRDHERLEKVLQEKVVDFTKNMDDEVRQRLNFRSPQDITTLIYGGGFCRHLGARFVPVRPTRFPITAILPQAICRATGTPVPHVYTQPATLLGDDAMQSSASSSYGAGASHGGSGASGARAVSGEGLGVHFTVKQVERALQYVDIVSKRSNMETVLASTAVVVLIARTKMGGLLEQVSLYCPSTGTGVEELNVRIVTDELLPVSDKPNLVTIMQLKDLIRQYKPLQKLQPRKKSGKRSWEMRNVLILTKCSHERLEPLVDTGVVEAIEETILGTRAPTKSHSSRSGRRGHQTQESSPRDDESGSEGVSPPPPLERVCFADLEKAFPTPTQGVDSFQADFAELGSSNAVPFSAKAQWEHQTRELVSLGGYEEAMRAMLSHCAGAMGTLRDAFRNTHVIPSAMPQGLHGQEQATTPGMLWTVTPPALHPILCSFLKGRAASSGADAMERVTVFLNPYKDIDLTFFSALQQLRFTEKKLQLFEEGCLFRAVLPESNDRVHGELCHCVTATGRLSSQAPNLQNIPKEEDLRRLMISRFGAKGRMIEADYSQLEVVVLAALSRDARMMQELREKVDFHCLRVSLMMKEPYADVVRKCKVEKDPVYIQLRQQAKVFSFQRQYGAGAATISSTTGLTEAEVDELIHAEEAHYKDLGRYYQLVMSCVQAGADRLLHLRTLDTGSWTANMRRVVMLTEPLYYFVVPTGSKFDFTKTRHSVPRLKNYPVQGLAGEIVQVMCGKVVRRFLETRNYGGKAFLVNTVHDCVWVDAHVSVEKQVAQDIERIMGSAQEVLNELWPDMKIDVPFSVEVASGVSLGEMSK